MHSEQERIERVRQQMRDQEKAKWANPVRDSELEGVWVAHVWTPLNGSPTEGEWIFAGFRRRRHKRKPQTMGRFFSKVRRQLGVEKSAPVMLMDLTTARERALNGDQCWRFRPPQRQAPKPKMAQRTVAIDKTKYRTRAKTKAFKLSKRETKFIALGKHSWDKRSPGYLYLGPLVAETKHLATLEARRLYRALYAEPLVIATSELSKPLRDAMARGRKVRAGVTRIQWPEVPPTFDDVLAKYWKKSGAERPIDAYTSARFHAAWEADGRPWLTVSWFVKRATEWATPPSLGDWPCFGKMQSAKSTTPRRVVKQKARIKNSPKKSCALQKKKLSVAQRLKRKLSSVLRRKR